MKRTAPKKEKKPARVTRKSVEEFFRKLQSLPQLPVPKVDFTTFENVDVTMSANSGV
ncbi:MAG: hypothetical protein IJS08_13820 [Victivallales bacterium]|nr:hypothetical protein [Victivallales bacterium]